MTTTLDTTREIAATHRYKAPKELLQRMWSNPEHLNKWWGPKGFTTKTHEMEFRTGGRWLFTMIGPDGADYFNEIRYQLVSPNKIAFDHDAERGALNFAGEVVFEEDGEETKLTWRLTFATPELREQVERERQVEAGLVSALSRLDEAVRQQDAKAEELSIVRKFKAPKSLVWSALTDPEKMKQWYSPVGFECQQSEGEVKSGAPWSSKMVMIGGPEMEMSGEYVEVQPEDFLSYTHRWKNEDGTYKPTTLITIRLTEHEGNTTMTFTQSGFWSKESAMAHLGGWASCLYKLGNFVGASLAHQELSLEREFNAPLDLVWNCWTDPAHLSQWFAPEPYTIPNCDIDLRAGGTFYLVMRSPEGMEHPMVAEFTDVEPKTGLEWINSVVGPDGEVAAQGGTRLSFTDLGGKTLLQVRVYMAALSQPGTYMLAGMEQGWNMTLDQLGKVLA